MSDPIWNFLVQRLDDDRAAASTPREVAEYETKARLLDWHQRAPYTYDEHGERSRGIECTAGCEACGDMWPCTTLVFLSFVYVDHPDFKWEWRRPFPPGPPPQPTIVEEPRMYVYYTAVCKGCFPEGRTVPFSDEHDRNEWAAAHHEATGHEVERRAENRTG